MVEQMTSGVVCGQVGTNYPRGRREIGMEGMIMSKKIIAVNAGPRMGWNTETLISEA